MYINTSVEWGNNSNSVHIQKFDIYKFVGYTTLFVNLPYKPNQDYKTLLKKIQSHSKLPIFGKIYISPKSLNELKTILKKISHKKEYLISIYSLDKDLLTYAIKDSRVDLLSFPNITDLSSITPGIVSLLKTHKKYLEFSLREVFGTSSKERSLLFHEIAKFLSIVSNNKQLLLYGGREDTIFSIRGPHELSRIFSAIFDLPIKTSKSIVQSNPSRILTQLQERANSRHYSQDIKVIHEVKEE